MKKKIKMDKEILTYLEEIDASIDEAKMIVKEIYDDSEIYKAILPIIDKIEDAFRYYDKNKQNKLFKVIDELDVELTELIDYLEEYIKDVKKSGVDRSKNIIKQEVQLKNEIIKSRNLVIDLDNLL